nr:N,N-dimethylformamidase beta subunit family domain-containing protein [Bremerella cremea]
MSDDTSPVPRRAFLKGTLATTMITTTAELARTAYAEARSTNDTLIQKENAKSGADDWQLTRVRVDAEGFRSPWIEGYCSKQSVAAGESIDVMVSCNPARSFRLELFRMGYYGGKGARLVKNYGPLEASTQPTPTPGEKNLHECRWATSLTIDIPADWLSGVYIGRLTTIPEPGEAYWQSHIVFVVRDNRPTDILFQVSDNTWQAYNRWPNNYSIYTHPKGNQGPWADVSFDRPYGREA